VQLDILHSIRGLEHARMNRAGYAIEYDYYPPTQLDPSLQVRSVHGLYFAGQINGTTGYEEAAGQGVVAGLGAGLAALGREPITLGRHTSYIGVLVDDLVTRGVDEPYRLFTSRSEFRLTVRQDNALERLAPIAMGLGLYTERELTVVERRFAADRETRRLANETSIQPDQAALLLSEADSHQLAHSVKIAELAKRQNMSLSALFAVVGVGHDLDPAAVVSTELEIKYAGYFERERVQADKLKRMGEFALPDDLDYAGMVSLTLEARHKLTTLRPRSLAQVSRIPGVSPSDIQNLVIEVERRHGRHVPDATHQ
jgi:tRNA uridine 5-carboxymethylaminomethyl modification enzyme